MKTKIKKPVLLYVLAALSAIYLFFGIYSELTYLTNKDYFKTDYFTEAEEKIAEVSGDSKEDVFKREALETQVQYRKIDNQNYVGNHTTLLFIHLIGIIGVMYMFKLHYKGFGLYVSYIILDIIFRAYAYSATPKFENFLIMNGVVSLMFIGAYYSIFYKIKKQNQDA